MKEVGGVKFVFCFSKTFSTLQKRVIHLLTHGKSTIGQSKCLEKSVNFADERIAEKPTKTQQKRFSQLQPVITVVKTICNMMMCK